MTSNTGTRLSNLWNQLYNKDSKKVSSSVQLFSLIVRSKLQGKKFVASCENVSADSAPFEIVCLQTLIYTGIQLDSWKTIGENLGKNGLSGS